MGALKAEDERPAVPTAVQQLGQDNAGNDLSRSRGQQDWDGLMSKRGFTCSFFFPSLSSPTRVPIPLLAPEAPTERRARLKGAGTALNERMGSVFISLRSLQP